MNDNILHVQRILRAAEKIKRYLVGKTHEELDSDDMLYDAVLMELMVIGEEAGRIDADFKEAHTAIEWHKMVGMRNRITHEYFHVDSKVVWDTCQEDIPLLQRKLKEI